MKSVREREQGAGTEWLYGRQPVREALRARRRSMFHLYVREGVSPSSEVEECVALCEQRRVPVRHVSSGRMDELCSDGNHQGLCLECSAYPYLSGEDLFRWLSGCGEGVVLVLDRVQDPQNVGSLLRSAECAGAAAAILCRDRAVGVTSAVARASAGAAEHMKIARVEPLPAMMKRLTGELGWRFLALAAERGAVGCDEVALTGRLGIVVGGEGRGIRPGVREVCAGALALPMLGQVSSLNVGVAGALALYESVRQRRAANRAQPGL